MVEKEERSNGDYVGDTRTLKGHANRDNYNEYFEMISDELVILIFTKLSSSSSSSSNEEAVDTFDDIKLLAQCSILSKRFNLLVSQVPTLSINSSDFGKIYGLCPKILKKFKHITSLQINHSTCHATRKREGLTKLPSVLCEATYRPHSYFMSVVSYESLTFYQDQQFKDSLMIANDAAAAADPARVFLRVLCHVVELMLLHHMLVSSIKDLENLQRVVVTNLDDGGMLILEADILVELRNCSATNLEQVQPRCWSRCFHYYDVPYDVKGAGLLARNMSFYVFEWYEKTTNDQIVYDDDEVGIPRALAFSGYKGEVHKFLLKSLLANTHDVNQKFDVFANQDQIIQVMYSCYFVTFNYY